MAVLQLPKILQSDSFDCGTAAMTCVMRFHKSRGAVIVADLATPEHGLGPETVEAAFRTAGWKVNAGERTLDDLQSNCANWRPVMVLITKDGVGHWCVAAGVTPKRVYFHDPEDGMRHLTHVEFLEAWNDIGRYGQTFRNFGLVAFP